ncbi:hypothetical protein I4U23_012039 [Adineta vaga]|nr:hypothetical protein I4U23_012039 [Adineta vaga]
MAISSIFSLLAYRNVRRIVRRQIPIIRRRLDQQMTTLVFARVILLVILYLPYIVYYMYWSTTSFDRTNLMQIIIAYLAGVILNSIVLFNHALTFYVFLIVSSRYRRQVKHLVVKRYWRQCKQFCQRNHNQIRPLREITDYVGSDVR